MRAVAAFVLLVATAAGAQVYKCQEGGRTVYSDAPCSGRSTVLDPSALRGNTMQRDPAYHLPPGGVRTAPPPPAVIPGQNQLAAGTTCPSDDEIRGLETKLTSIEFSQGRKRSEREFLERELRRARACRIEGGSYTAEEWRRIKDAQDAQGNIRPEDRQRERSTALGIHGPAASDRENQRMQADQQEDAIREAARRARAAEASRVITNCDQGGCWDNRGTRYNGTGTTLFSTEGKTCTRVGSMMTCN